MAPPAGGPATLCARLQAELPGRLAGQSRRATDPASPRTAAWGRPPIVLRCGVAVPPAGTTQPLLVDGRVAWLTRVEPDAVRWTALDRAVAVEVVVPKSYGAASDILVALTAAVARTVPAQRSPVPRASAPATNRSSSAG